MVVAQLGAAGFPDQDPDHPAPEGQGQFPEFFFHLHIEGAEDLPAIGPEIPAGQFLQIRLITGSQTGGLGQLFSDPRVLGFQKGKEFLPYPVPFQSQIFIGAVQTVLQSLFSTVGFRVPPGDFQERTGQISAHRQHAPHSPGPGTPEQVQEHGLCLVILVMSQEDSAGSRFFPTFFKSLVPQLPGRFF